MKQDDLASLQPKTTLSNKHDRIGLLGKRMPNVEDINLLEQVTSRVPAGPASIKVKTMSASWSSSEKKLTLQKINFEVNKVCIMLMLSTTIGLQLNSLLRFYLYDMHLVTSPHENWP